MLQDFNWLIIPFLLELVAVVYIWTAGAERKARATSKPDREISG